MSLIRLANERFVVQVDTLGAAVNRLRLLEPGVDLLLGYPATTDREAGEAYLGEIVGPVANRIAAGRFVLEGTEHSLATNDRGNTLHGGPDGFSEREWTVDHASDADVQLSLVWADPAGGFPGTQEVTVHYVLTAQGLEHTITVRTDAPALVSPCSHPYFNLAGPGVPVTDHILTVEADAYLPIDDTGIPLPSAPEPVEGTPLDLRAGVRIGDAIAADHPQIHQEGGIDHAYVLAADADRPCATLQDPASGRRLEIWTDAPSLQVYTGQALGEAGPGVDGRPHVAYGGVALETQWYPDSANRPDFPSTLLQPGQEFRTRTAWHIPG